MGQDTWIPLPTLLPTGTMIPAGHFPGTWTLQPQTVDDSFMKEEYMTQCPTGPGTLGVEGTTSVSCRRLRVT